MKSQVTGQVRASVYQNWRLLRRLRWPNPFYQHFKLVKIGKAKSDNFHKNYNFYFRNQTDTLNKGYIQSKIAFIKERVQHRINQLQSLVNSTNVSIWLRIPHNYFRMLFLSLLYRHFKVFYQHIYSY